MAPNTTKRIIQIANPIDFSVYKDKLQGSLEKPSTVHQDSSELQEVTDEEQVQLETIVQIANPFDQPVYKLNGSLEEASAVYYQGRSGQQEVADEDDDEPSVRITTRARITYELDRFSKNEMLFINNVNTDPAMTLYLMTAFQNYKFEFTFIETAEEDVHEIWRKIDQFFQKDFTNIGIAAVVTSLSSPNPGLSTANRVEEWDVLDYYMANQPASLQGRPKIFISETPEPSNHPDIAILPSDTLLIQVKKVAHNTYPRPLDLLLYKLISMEDVRDILDILSEVKNEATQAYPRHATPVQCINTLTKELLLEKNTQKYSCQRVDKKNYAVLTVSIPFTGPSNFGYLELYVK